MTDRPLITAAEMDRMTASERAAAVESGVVHDLNELPEAFRSRVIKRATELNDRISKNK